MTSPSFKPESAKQRSLRIPLDFVRPSSFQRIKTIAALVGAVTAAAYAIWILAGPDSARMQLSPGSLAAAHAPWDQRCETCHENFVPLRADAHAQLMKRLSSVIPFHKSAAATGKAETGGLSTTATNPDAKCQACHAPPDHFVGKSTVLAERCTSCHIDHEGRNAKITQTDDQHCTRCHATLETPVQAFGMRDDGSPGHPDFKSLRRDPGNIRFNHQLHMTKGLPASDQ